MDSLISRQAAIDAVEESRHLNHHRNGKEACAHEYEHRHFLKILMELPTIEPMRWIPCSERLPEVNGRYLVVRGLKAAGAIWNRVYIVNYSDLMGLKSSKIFWQGNVGKSDFEKLEDVLAWMPLPEPWRGEEHDR